MFKWIYLLWVCSNQTFDSNQILHCWMFCHNCHFHIHGRRCKGNQYHHNPLGMIHKASHPCSILLMDQYQSHHMQDQVLSVNFKFIKLFSYLFTTNWKIENYLQGYKELCSNQVHYSNHSSLFHIGDFPCSQDCYYNGPRSTHIGWEGCNNFLFYCGWYCKHRAQYSNCLRFHKPKEYKSGWRDIHCHQCKALVRVNTFSYHLLGQNTLKIETNLYLQYQAMK